MLKPGVWTHRDLGRDPVEIGSHGGIRFPDQECGWDTLSRNQVGQSRQAVLWVRGLRAVRAESLEPEKGAGRREMSSRRVGMPL